MAESLVIEINGNVKKYQDSLKKAKSETAELEAQLTSIAKVSAVAFAGLAAVIIGVVNEAAKIETVTTQFEVLTGSVEQAKKIVKELQEFSAATPFQFEGIAKASTQLLGFGFTADEIIPKLQQLGDVAAASGRPIQEISLIFGQVSAAGKLTGERLLQFQERAIPIGPAIAKTMGIAEDAVKDMVSAGKVDFAIFEKAFASLSQVGGPAFEGMIKQSKTFAGVVSTLKDNITLFAAEIGKNLLPLFKKLALAAISGLEFLRRNPEIAKTVATLLLVASAITGVIATLAIAAVVFLKLRAAMIATKIAIKGMTFSIKGLVGATGIGLLLLVVTDLALNWEKRWAQMQAIFQVFVSNMTNIGKGLATFLIGIATVDLTKIKKGFDQLKNVTIKSFNELADDPAFSDPEKDPLNKFFPGDDKVKEKSKESTDAILAAKMEQFEAILEQDQELREMLDELGEEERIKKVEQLTNDIATEQEMRDQAIDERFKKDKIAQRKFIEDTKKHGKVLATINRVLGSQEVQDTKNIASQLSQLQRSKNKTLASIGRAAAVTKIAIDTAVGAASIFAQLNALIPFLAPAIGAAGAAAIIAFGAEKTSNVLSAQRGALITGGIPGIDSVNVLAQQGELISPVQNFEEVIGSVRAKREAESLGGGGIGGGQIGIEVSYDSTEASQIVTVRQVEDTALGISQDSFKEAS